MIDFLERLFLGEPPKRHKYADLALYNAEVGRGLMHTEEWQAKMEKQQQEFNEAALAEESET